MTRKKTRYFMNMINIISKMYDGNIKLYKPAAEIPDTIPHILAEIIKDDSKPVFCALTRISNVSISEKRFTIML